jgi:signal transduction histidine kinase
MKLTIHTRLLLQFSFIVTLILVLFSISIFYFYSFYRKSEFYSRLENKAVNTAKLLITLKVDYNLIKIIDRNTSNLLIDEKVLIYNYKDELIYNSTEEDTFHLSKEFLDKIRMQKEVRFKDGKNEAIGLLYTEKHNHYIVLASAFDQYGISKLNFLKSIIMIGFLISIGLNVVTGSVFAKRALRPILDVVKQVSKITVESLDVRVNEGNKTDEIAQLSMTFNQMLDRLEKAFEMQRSFVSNTSHELRTPLTSITGQIEVSLMKHRSQKEYKNILESVLEDIKNLNLLINGLLDMAKVSSDISTITFQKLRFDEILWETRGELIQRKKEYDITINFSNSINDEEKLKVSGNKYLLKIAILNLMDNGCKFSPDKSVKVYLSASDKDIHVEFRDQGIGISADELEKIFHPFFRASNAKSIIGYGIGLSLTDKIIILHKGKITVDSKLNEGTIITISIPSIS